MKKIYWVLFLGICIGTMLVRHGEVAAKPKVKEMVVMEGATRELTPAWHHAKISISNKKKAKVLREKSQSYRQVSPANGLNYGLLVQGKKKGKTNITVKVDGKILRYKVTVLSQRSIQRKAAKKLKSSIAKYQKAAMYLYDDFNGDGLKEIYHDGYFTYYNYAVNKVVTKAAPYQKCKKLYYSKKYHMMFAIPATDTVTKDPDPDYGDYDRIVYGYFFFFNEAKVFDFLNEGVSYAKYVYPEKFVAQYVPGTDYYFLNDNSYDQDDYWYEPYTLEQLKEKLKKWFPNYVE